MGAKAIEILLLLLVTWTIKRQRFSTLGVYSHLILSPTPSYPTSHSVGCFSISRFFPLSCRKHIAKTWHLDHAVIWVNYLRTSIRIWYVRKTVQFRVGVRKEIMLGTPRLSLATKDPESWGSWRLGYLLKIFICLQCGNYFYCQDLSVRIPIGEKEWVVGVRHEYSTLNA